MKTYYRLDRIKEDRYAVSRIVVKDDDKSMQIIDYLIKVRIQPTNDPYFSNKDAYVQWQLKNRNSLPGKNAMRQRQKGGLLTWGLERGKTAHLSRRKAFDYACVS